MYGLLGRFAAGEIAITEIMVSLERCVFWMTQGHDAVDPQGGQPAGATTATVKKAQPFMSEGRGQEAGSSSRLSAKDLSMLSIAISAAQNRFELGEKIAHGLRNGVTDAEILEILDEVAQYRRGGRAQKTRCDAPSEDP